jgi:hypothetical protein
MDPHIPGLWALSGIVVVTVLFRVVWFIRREKSNRDR